MTEAVVATYNDITTIKNVEDQGSRDDSECDEARGA
jgi:hypothetical protein